jgi:hypothetical protein
MGGVISTCCSQREKDAEDKDIIVSLAKNHLISKLNLIIIISFVNLLIIIGT